LEELLPKDNENILLSIVGPVEPSEPVGFKPDEMLRCEECLRANPPTRVNCLYCGVALQHTESSARLRKPTLRQPERNQEGYNSILLPDNTKTVDEQSLKTASSLLKLSDETLRQIMSAGFPLPVARTANEDEAQLVLDRLGEVGLPTVTLSDSMLGLLDPSERVRSLRFDDETVQVFHSGRTEPSILKLQDIVLLVSGRLIRTRIEVEERKSRQAENEIIDTSQFFADETVVDFYATSHHQTWRISANSFDFSCLQEKKTLVAGENLVSLIKVITSRASHAKLNETYNRLKQTLEPVWTLEQETTSSGWRRHAPGKYSLGEATMNSNESQFTRYSRLLHYFMLNPIS
jgi:hypothetical protein